MRRLSEIIENVVCHKCGSKGLTVIHAEVHQNNVTAMVGCPGCRAKDVLRFNFGEFGRMDNEEVAAGRSEDESTMPDKKL